MVRAASSCLISWLQAAAYQAFDGNALGKALASVIGFLPGDRMYTGRPLGQLDLRLFRCCTATSRASRSSACIQIKRKAPSRDGASGLSGQLDLAALTGSLTLGMVANSTL